MEEEVDGEGEWGEGRGDKTGLYTHVAKLPTEFIEGRGSGPSDDGKKKRWMDGMSLPVSLSPSFLIFFRFFFLLTQQCSSTFFPQIFLFEFPRRLVWLSPTPVHSFFQSLTNTWPPRRGSIKKPSGKAPVLDHLSNSVQFRLNDERDKVHDPIRLTSEAKAGGAGAKFPISLFFFSFPANAKIRQPGGSFFERRRLCVLAFLIHRFGRSRGD